MMGLIDEYKTQIRTLCEGHKVKTLHSFGSVNTNRFNPNSDVDFVVDFHIDDPLEYTDNYFEFKFGLERILQRQVDLLETKALKNPFLKANIDKTKVLVYG